MPCLICKYWQPTEPQEHKMRREANACRSGCGTRWDHHTAIQYVKKHGSLQGWCRLHPEPMSAAYNHVCGQIDTFKFVHNASWGVPRLGEEYFDETIFEWAGKALTTLMNGTQYEQERDGVGAENRELRRRLKAARKISASRLARLRARESGDKSKLVAKLEGAVAPTEPPAKEVEAPLDEHAKLRLRLVAAE